VHQKTFDYPDDLAYGHRIMLDTGVRLTVRREQVDGLNRGHLFIIYFFCLFLVGLFEAGFWRLVRLALVPPCWNCGTRFFRRIASTKSMWSSEGTLNENFVIPLKLLTAKSPWVMMFMPIKMSASPSSPFVTRMPTKSTLSGRLMFTRYTSDSALPCTPVTSVRPIGDNPHVSITA